jgi:hypothetical protein
MRIRPRDLAETLEGASAIAVRDNILARLSFSYPGLRSPCDGDGPAFERLLALTLIRFREHSSCFFLEHFFDSVNVELIQNTPLRSIPAENNSERQGLLWIWLTMVDLWKTDTAAQLEWLQKVIKIFPEVGSWMINDFKRFGNRFLWREELTDEISKHWPIT